jgi:glycosyltransferase involved in cell wall biosynthesis
MEKNPTRVCHVVNSVGPTSIPATIAIKLQQFSDLEMGLLSWFEIEDFKGMGDIQIYAADSPQGMLGMDYSTFNDVRNIFKEYDIIHTHHPHSGSLSKIIASKLNRKLITTEHNQHIGYTRKGRLSNGLTNMLADNITSVSNSVVKSFQWWEKALVSSGRLHVIYNGVEDTPSIHHTNWSVYDHCNIDPEEYLIGISAMHTEQKGHAVLIKAVSKLIDEGNRINLVITGKGPLSKKLERLVLDQGVEDYVHFVGLIEREKLYKLLGELNLYSMPSHWEGFCVGVAQAMSVGTPCILSDIDVFREVYKNCALYHQKDDFQELASEIEFALSDENLLDHLSRCGKKLVTSRYSMSKMASQYRSLYKDMA